MILPRRRFLFLAPAIVVASSLMSSHSISKLLEPPIRRFWRVYDKDTYILHDQSGISTGHTFPHEGWLHEPIYNEVTKQISCWTRTERVRLTQTEVDAYFIKKTHVADDKLFFYDNAAITEHYSQTGPAKSSILNDTKLKPFFSNLPNNLIHLNTKIDI